MNREEFVEKWNCKDSVSGLRFVQFDGGAIYATHMMIINVVQHADGNITEQDVIYLSKDVAGVHVDVGNIQLDKIEGIN